MCEGVQAGSGMKFAYLSLTDRPTNGIILIVLPKTSFVFGIIEASLITKKNAAVEKEKEGKCFSVTIY